MTEVHSSLGDLTDMETRIACLEAQIGVHRGVGAKNLRPRQISLAAKVQSLLDSHQLAEFIQQYEQLSRLLMAGDVDDFFMTMETKKTVLLSCEGFFVEVASLLEEMKELESHAAVSTDIAGIDKHMKPLKALHLDSQRQGAEFSTRFELLLKSYNEFVTLMSHKFVHWDHMLTELEQ